MSSIHTLSFREDAAESCLAEPEIRLTVVCDAMRTLGGSGGRGLLVLPAGFVLADSTEERDRWADALLATSRQAGVGIVFGIDVDDRDWWGGGGRMRSFGYAIDRGRPLLWAAIPGHIEDAEACRTVTFDGLRATVLFGRELFQQGLPAIVAAAWPDVALVLAHAGPTARWLLPLAELDAVVPALMAHQDLPLRRPVPTPVPRGYQVRVTRGPVRLTTYRRSEAVGVTPTVVGN
jgi:hypothetical protein